MDEIYKIVTARQTEFTLGWEYKYYNKTVVSIKFVLGDPSVGVDSGYVVTLEDGTTIEVTDVNEVHRKAQS